MRLLLKNGTVVNPASASGKFDILIEDGRIFALDSGLSSSFVDIDEEIDISNLMVAPGLVDVHVHFRDPGQTHKEDISTGVEAAKHGGFTTVVMMANTNPPIDNVETLQYVLEKGAQTDINVLACANVTRGMAGKELTEMEALVRAGAVGFTDDGKPITDQNLLEKAMYQVAKLGVPISLHEEDPLHIGTSGYNRGKASEFFGISGAAGEAEYTLIARDIELARKTGARVVIQHISTREGVLMVRSAQAMGIDIHAEATPHHFSLTEQDAITHNVMAKMNPPLRTEEDRQMILKGLQTRTIDMIATDHAPHTSEEKAKGLTEAPSGIIGLETSLGLGITNLVKPGILTIEQLITRMSVGPAEVYGLEAGVIAPGRQADLVIFDPEETWVVSETFASKAKNSPFIGRELTGKVKYTICKGRVVYTDM